MLQEKQRTKLTKQILLFSSSYDGEVLAAVAAANRTLAKNNSSWHEVVASLEANGKGFDQGLGTGYDAGYADGYRHGANGAQSHNLDHHQMLSQLKHKAHVLNDWSKSFIENLHNHKDWCLSAKQCAVIERLHRQFCGS